MDIAPPPAVYDHAYRGMLVEKHGTSAEVEDFCHRQQGIASPYRALGCAIVRGDRCYVVISRVGGRITAYVQRQIRRHEIAHCNGWPANHPRPDS